MHTLFLIREWNDKIMRSALNILLFGLLLCILIAEQTFTWTNKTKEHAEERLQAFAREINYRYEEPDGIYDYLCADFKESMTSEAFVEAFKKERSYPYLVPLFINFRSIELSSDRLSGMAYFSQAARLPGMVYKVPFVYENGDYYMKCFDEFPSGEYLKKFVDIPYSLDMYFDFENS